MNIKKHPLYWTWNGMKNRCLNPSNKDYHKYGGRGITIYDGWRYDFQEFVDFMGPKPGPEYSLDRIDNNDGYYPHNVRWADKSQQSRNARNVKLTQEDVDHIRLGTLYDITDAMLAELYGISAKYISNILTGKRWAKGVMADG